MSWFKKGPLLGFGGGFLVCWLLVVLFFDPVLKRALEKGGGAANGARVEVASLKTKWLAGTLELKGLEVADRSEPMKNLVVASRAGFRLDTSALVRGKAVVREAAIEGLRFGTARKTSGVLSAVPPSGLEKAVLDKIAPVKTASLAQAAQVKGNASTEVDAAKLAGLKKLDDAKAKIKEIEARWAAKAGEAKEIEAEAKKLAEDAKALGGGGSPADILRKVAEGQKLADRVKALTARVEASRDQARKDIAEAQALVKEADELRKKDLNGLLAEAGLPTLDSSDLARRLLGAQTAGRLATAMKWMKLAREKASARKAAVPPPPARRAGVDIEFPRAHSYPQFLLEGAKLSGSLDGAVGGADADLAGLLNGVTSNPKLYGKPATLDLTGRSAKGPALKLAARLDQQDEPVGVSATFEGSGFPLAGAALGDGEVGGALTGGSARVRGSLALKGEEWSGEVLVEATGVSLEPKVSLTGPAGAMAADALKSMNAFNVKIGISGREDDLKLAFTSNVGDLLAGAMKKAFAGQLEGRRKELEAKLAGLYGGKDKDARSAADGLTGKILGPLDQQKAGLDRLLKDALGKSANKPFGGLFR